MDETVESAACLVVIRGVLDHGWADYLGDLTILSKTVEGQAHTTILAGTLPDFAAFVGLIGRLQNLGLPVQTITFNRLPAAQLA
jgi:hypothetical protein